LDNTRTRLALIIAKIVLKASLLMYQDRRSVHCVLRTHSLTIKPSHHARPALQEPSLMKRVRLAVSHVLLEHTVTLQERAALRAQLDFTTMKSVRLHAKLAPRVITTGRKA
jgi:hypothetical protein